jgi:aminoglycoside phosphotransferase (APT) family kinase protein
MLLGLAPAGREMAAEDYTEHDISQVGLRLAWMHRLLAEQLKPPAETPSLADRFYDQFFQRGPEGERPTPASGGKFAEIHAMLRAAAPQGWAHGDITPAALLHDGDHQLRTVTDWGHLHWGCPLEDLVGAFLFLSTNREGMLERARGHALMEAYDSLVPLKGTAWTPVVASWCGQRMIAAARPHETGEPGGEAMEAPLAEVLRQPERIAVAMAACLKA